MIGLYRITANLMEVDATEWIKEQMKDDKNTIL